MTTLKSFLDSTSIPESLARAVVKQSNGWTEFKGHASDIANHGTNGGFVGFTYYTETVPFTERNKVAILDMAKQQARDYGSENVFTMISQFNASTLSPEEVAEAMYNPESENQTELFNLLAFYSLEEVARAYIDFCEQS